jgi:hypothetical protein
MVSFGSSIHVTSNTVVTAHQEIENATSGMLYFRSPSVQTILLYNLSFNMSHVKANCLGSHLSNQEDIIPCQNRIEYIMGLTP